MFKTSTLSALSLSLLLVACGGESASNNSSAPADNANAETTMPTHAPTGNGNVYRVVTEQSYAPFITRDEHGVAEGFDIDLIKAIAQNQGFQISFETDTINEIPNRLNNGTADIAASGITVTDKRKEVLDFSEPYYQSTTVLIAGKNANELEGIKDVKDLKGKTISVQRGSFQADTLSKVGAESVYEDTAWLTIKQVIAGKALASLGDKGAMGYYVTQYPNEGLKIITIPNAHSDNIAFGVKKGNGDLLNKLNNGLAALKADGTYDQLYRKWFKN